MIIPANILRLMDPATRARYETDGTGQGAKNNQAAEATITQFERNHHAVFQNWLLAHGYPFRHSRTDRATRETVGAPDFSVYERRDNTKEREPVARALLIEFKLPGNKLSPTQQWWADNCGATLHIVASAAQAIELVKELLP